MGQLQRDLFELLRSYAALVPPHTMPFPSHMPTPDVHDFLLNFVLLNEHFRSYPPSKTYQCRFWKWAIHHLTAEQSEVRCSEY